MLLLDTNALVYVVAAASPFHARGRDRVSHARRAASPAFVTLTEWNVNRYACCCPASDSIAGPTPRKGRFSFSTIPLGQKLKDSQLPDRVSMPDGQVLMRPREWR